MQRILILNAAPPGPLDLVPNAVFDCSVHRQQHNYAGALLNIRNSGTGAKQDVYPDWRGSMPTGFVSAFLGASNGFVTKCYDESGNNCDATQSTSANQPQLGLTASPSGRPSLLFSAGPQYLLTSCSPTLNTPFSSSAVAERTGVFTAQGLIWSANSADGFAQLGFNSTVNQAFIYAGIGFSAAQADSEFHVLQALFNSSSSTIGIDGSFSTGDSGTHGFGSNVLAIGYNQAFGAQALTGWAGEIILRNFGMTTGQFSSDRTSEKVYFGTP